MTMRHGLEIRSATPAEAPGLAILLAEAGLVLDPRDVAERLAMLRQGTGAALVALPHSAMARKVCSCLKSMVSECPGENRSCSESGALA
jgi:hypothetical protein